MDAVRIDDAGSPAAVPHGTASGYSTFGCRCDECRAYKRERNRQHYAANRAEIIAQRRDFQVANRAEVVAKRRVRASKPAAREAGRLSRHRQRGAAPTPDARRFVPVLLADPCAYCGASGGELDHIEPIVRGGDGDWLNLTSACRSCNASKSDRPLLQFLISNAA